MIRLCHGPAVRGRGQGGVRKLIDWGSKEIIKKVSRGNPSRRSRTVEAGFKSLKATVESGEMDVAAALRGPNKDGFYTAVAAVHCKEGPQLEKAVARSQ